MITPGYLALHSQGRSGGRDVALLDVCQDYALYLLCEQGAFDLGVVLKGGTSLRKFRAGNAGRFSTDLDFAAPDSETAELVMDVLDEKEIFDIHIRVVDRNSFRGRLEFDTAHGRPKVLAKLELSPRALWLPVKITEPISLPVHKGYEFTPPALPVPAIEEAIAEKLAAWRRRRKMRDLYDLFWYGKHTFDESLVRRVFVLKVWHDVVDDGLGRGPLSPDDVTAYVDPGRIVQEDIGLLTQPVQPELWLKSVRKRFQFLRAFDGDETRIARCSPADTYLVTTLVEQLQVAVV